MIDLHCHLLPGIDDGAADLATSLQMARLAVEDGITHLACTPHITPGVYDNTGSDIAERIAQLQAVLDENNLPLHLWRGADVHIAPDLAGRIASGAVPTLGGSRYFLFEPPTHVVPPRIEVVVKSLVEAGFVPVLTHPERLRWIEQHYDKILEIISAGALVQLTAASVTGRFGQRAKYWADRMLDEGLVDILATDAHNTTSRPPILSQARDVVAKRLGETEANEMVWARPADILNNEMLEPVGRAAIRDGRQAQSPRPEAGVRAWWTRFRR